MNLQAFLWLILPLFVAGGSALVAYYIMQARMEVALSRERESLAEVRATLQSAKVTMEERIKATEEATRRAALDELMQDLRVEERSYVRDISGATGARRSMVLQERVFFRNLPMSSWSEREMLIEEGATLSNRPVNFEPTVIPAAVSTPVSAQVQSQASRLHEAPPPVMTPVPLQPETRVAISKKLDPVAPPPRGEARTLVAVHAAFGAQ